VEPISVGLDVHAQSSRMEEIDLTTTLEVEKDVG